MLDFIARHAEAQPEGLALAGPTQRWSYSELDEAVADAQAGMKEVGIGPEDRVGVHVPRSAEVVILLWALWRAGAVAVPLSLRLPATQVVRHARHVNCRQLITSDTAVETEATGPLSVLPPGSLFEGSGPRTDPGPWPPDRPATILFTSGSTGTPKAVLHSWANHLYSAKGANANVPLQAGDRWMLSLPLYHVGGLAIVIRCAMAGAAVRIPSSEALLHKAVYGTQVTHVSLVPTQLRRLVQKDAGPPPDSLQAVLLGGGPIPDPLLRRGDERGWPLHTSYGSTEMASQVTTTAPGAPLDELQTAGRCLPHRRLRVVDGEILVAGPTLCRGYVTEEGLIDPRTEDGWFPTGDRGRVDADGRLHVIGRVDRMFVSGGENIQPEEIEGALEQVEGVERAVIVSVPDSEYGQRPIAFVRGREEIDSTSLEEALSETLPGFKVPDSFHVLPDRAEGKGLKIDREHLRKKAYQLRSSMSSDRDTD